MNDTIASMLGRHWWVLLLYGVIAVIFGFVAITQPLATAVSLAWVFGVMAVAEAVVSLIALFSRDAAGSRGWLLFYAVVSAVLGLLAIFHPMAVAGALLMLLAIWLIVAGIYRIVFAIRVRKVIRGEWLIILTGVLGIVLGIMFLASPVAGLAATTWWIGILALFYGVLQIIAGFRLRRLRKL